MQLTSTAFGKGETIPPRFTCDGVNHSPPLAWSGVPAGTQSLLLVCDDPDAPGGTFRHWAAYNIPTDWTGLAEGYGRETVADVLQAVNDFGRAGYGGPCPPRGDRPHAYRFRLSALSGTVDLAGPRATCAEVVRLARPMEIAAAELVGYYGRPRHG